MTLARLENTAPSSELERMMGNARQASDFLKALSHESRLLILCLLAEGEKSVGQIEDFLSQRQSTVSQQLARLRFDGLVTTRRDGKTIYYSLASEDVSTILDTVHKIFCKPASPRRR